MSDNLKRFLFDDAPVRGAMVQLESSWQQVIDRHDYPDDLKLVLGEMLAAATLLCSNIKFQGALIMQLHGTGALRLAVVECTHDLVVRATAKWEGPLNGLTLQEMLGHEGKFVITLDQLGAAQPYQGIVALEGRTIAEMLQHYMQRSEQLETYISLAANEQRACGLLLQRLPEGHGPQEGWQMVEQLAHTVTPLELINLPPLQLLHRLFHQMEVRVLADAEVAFGCRCSRDKVANMLRMLGRDEVMSLVAEQGSVQVGCEFCHTQYVFDGVDAEALFASIGSSVEGSSQHH